ncbi:hypothetical protein, partial [Streptomyces cadmiisoli]|uniref:hypothetical protein n=1 Tax=Streptomyces cadmiisoli TaxID=2184053 RepID=UPI003D715286
MSFVQLRRRGLPAHAPQGLALVSVLARRGIQLCGDDVPDLAEEDGRRPSRPWLVDGSVRPPLDEPLDPPISSAS